jgi:enoyl-CoA hydratase/3-hydroxyacyl-CoA dehydrogenase
MRASGSRPIRRLAVIGAGNMGSGIAHKFAIEGFGVVLVDLDDERVLRGLRSIEKTLEDGIERRIFTEGEAREIRNRILGTTDVSAAAEADVVIEAVFEDLAVKREVFRKLDEVTRPEAILATNTSSLSVTELARATREPGRVLGLHYFFPPVKNRLVEVVPADPTRAEVFRRAWALQERIGKTPIRSSDRAGFIVNRFFVPWLNEAVRIFEEGESDIATIEEAAKNAFGVGIGPFELMNLTGIPIAFHAARTLAEAFGPLYAPARKLEEHARSGRLWPLEGSPDPTRFEAVSDRLRGIVFYAASALVAEGVGTIEDTDIGARVGLRWPRGPFETMNRLGIERAASLAREIASRWGLDLPPLLETRAREGRPFSFERVRSELRDGIAVLTIHRPDALNALNEEVVSQLHDALRRAEADPSVRGIVLAGSGKAFVAGADVRFFVRHMEAGRLDRIVEFTKSGHALLDAIDRCPKPVVARLHGLALGGGVELALACDRIVATPSATLAFPETGLGIYPGLGGTQRLPRRVGVALARWLISTGETLSAEEALSIGLVDRVVEHESLDDAVAEAVEAGPVSDRRPGPVPDSHRALAEFFATYHPDAIREGRADTGGRQELERAAKQVRGKAPIALRLACRLVDRSAELPLEEGLQMELAHLLEVFSTRDAHEGLSSLVGGRKPAFEGR